MIDWREFETQCEMGEYWAAFSIVSQGVDGVAVKGTPHVIRCTSCDAVAEGDEVAVGAGCEKCSVESSLKWFCLNHPTSLGSDENKCPCCHRGLKPLNNASPELVDKVVEVCNEVDMFESKGALFEELKAAFRSGDEQRAAEIFETGKLNGWRGAEQLVGLARDSRRVIGILGELETTRADGDYFSLVDLWDKNRKALVVRTSAEKFRDLVEQWRPRNDGARQVLAAWQRQPVDSPLLVKLWEIWRDRIVDHPEIVPVLQQVQHQVNQQVQWDRFTNVDHASSQRVDELRVSLWDDKLFEGWKPAGAAIADVVAAGKRLEIVAAVQQVLESEAEAVGGGRDRAERAVQFAGDLPLEYAYDDRDAVELAGRQLNLLLQLEEAIQGATSDLAVVAAWTSLSELQGDGLLDDTGARKVVQLAQQREESIRQVRSIPVSELDIQECDRQLLEAWPVFLDGCPDVRDLYERCQHARGRRLLLEALEVAINDNSVPRIAELGGDPLLDHWPFSERQRMSIDSATCELECLDEVEAVLDRGDVERFAEIFDADLFLRHQHRDSLVARRDRIIELATTAVIPNERNGTRLAFFGGLKRNANGAVRVRWGWPDPRISNRCRLSVCPVSVEGNGQLVTETRVFEQIVARSVVEIGDGAQPIPVEDDWMGYQVVVQCLIDLGFVTLEGQPLVLGVLGRDTGSAV
jgi:hypothetical protein